jgi:L-threonylcarbamoyladenylate synthase
LESTIVAVDERGLRLLRPGPVPLEKIAAAARLGMAPASGRIEAPGQLPRHYSPSKPLRLHATTAEGDEWLIGFGGVPGDDNLSPSGDLDAAAARLFDALHRAERQPRPRIAVAPIPDQGIGVAINDRLSRAAAPKETD